MIDYKSEIKAVQKHYNYKARHLSLKAGLNKEYVANIVNDKTAAPKVDCLIAIARTLNNDRITRKETFKDIRMKLGNNIIIDLMEAIERRRCNEWRN